MPAPIFPIQASFAGGEFSPSLYSRVDIAKYLTGTKTLRNFNVLPHGGARNRPGTQYVASAGISADPVRVVPFIASTNQAYVLEVGNFYMRFYKGGVTNPENAQVQFIGTPAAWVASTQYVVGNYVEANAGGGNTIYYCLVANVSTGSFAADLASGYWVNLAYFQIPTPWPSSAIFNLKFTQSADVMYFACPGYAPQKLTFFSQANWTLTQYGFANGPFQLQNTDQTLTLTPSAVQSGAGSTVNLSQLYVMSWGGVLVSTVSAHGLTNGQTIQISGVTGTGAVFNGLWGVNACTTESFQLCPVGSYSQYISSLPQGSYLAGSAVEAPYNPITITASAPLFQAGHVGALFQLQRTIVAQTITASMAANTYVGTSIPCGSTWAIVTLGSWTGRFIIQASIDGVNWSNIQTLQGATPDNYQTSGSTGYSQCYVRVVGDGATTVPPLSVGTPVTWSGTMTYNLTANSFDWNGVVQIVTVGSSTSATAIVVTNTENAWPLADTSATFQWSEGSWSTLRGWPTCVAFYQDRLAWASTPTEPQTIWFSQTADYGNFGISEPVVDTDSISAVIPGRQLNAIQSLIVMPQFLVALTSDSEWAIQPANGNGSFTPSSINIQLQGHRGSAAITPVVVGIELILMQQMGTVVRNLIFQLAVNGFFGDNISIVSQHLFTGYQIVEMAYQQEPDSIIWAVRNDGQLLSCTYMRDQEMNAWSHHDTHGNFESVCTIPNATIGFNEVWVVVNRTLNHQVTRCIERLMPRDQGTTPASQWFVDCGFSENISGATSFAAPAQLVGQTVSILADGNVIPQMVCTNTITLPVATQNIIIGLPYVCDLETLTIEAPNQKGTLQGRRVAIPEVTFRFWNSRGGYFMACSEDVGPADNVSDAGFDEIEQRSPQDNYDTPIALKTRDYKVSLDGGYDFGAHMFFRQVDPLPVTILGILPSVVAGEK